MTQRDPIYIKKNPLDQTDFEAIAEFDNDDFVPVEHGGTGATTESDARANLGVDAVGIKALYESNPDTNAFTDADEAKLDAIESGAEVNTVDSVFGRFGDITAQSGDYTASQVDVSPTGGISATDVQAAIEELDTEKAATAHTHAASDISYTPGGRISATDVQAAITELDNEKLALDGTQPMSGSLDMGGQEITNVGDVDGRDVSADGIKLDGIESGATADQTGAEIKALYEAEPDTNAFTDADHSKLDGIESGATADQDADEVPYENVTSGLTATDVQGAIDELDATLDGLANGMVFKGTYDVGGGAGPVNFPGGGSAEIGDFYVIINAAAGGTTLGSINPMVVNTGDAVVANTNSASQTDGAEWNKIDSTDQVSSVHGRTGAVVGASGDYTASQITNVPAGGISAADVQAAINELDTEKAAVAHSHGTSEIDNNAITNAKIRDSAALSVIGRPANSVGDPADIAAGSDGQILRRSGAVLGFGTIVNAGIANSTIQNAKLALQNQATVKGRAQGAGTGAVTDLNASQVRAIIGALGNLCDKVVTVAMGAPTGTSASVAHGISDMDQTKPFLCFISFARTGLNTTVPGVIPPASFVSVWKDNTNINWSSNTDLTPFAFTSATAIIAYNT